LKRINSTIFESIITMRKFFGRVVHGKTRRNGGDTNRFTRTGRTCDQQVRHPSKVGIERIA
jgi:hypothetical protein